MEENFIQSKEYTHKILDYKNGGICVFYGSEKDCENYLKLNKSKNNKLKLKRIYNEI